MKRRWWVAGVILALAVGVSAPLWDDLWLAVVYERHYVKNPRLYPHTAVCFEKRLDWLPGEAVYFPNQVCDQCYYAEDTAAWADSFERHVKYADVEGIKKWMHAICWMRKAHGLITCHDEFIFEYDQAKWRCTCSLRATDPDHP